MENVVIGVLTLVAIVLLVLAVRVLYREDPVYPRSLMVQASVLGFISGAILLSIAYQYWPAIGQSSKLDPMLGGYVALGGIGVVMSLILAFTTTKMAFFI